MVRNSSLRIGLFDSGVGGLTVLKQIYRQMPRESILYLADTARLPYGTKSPEEILRYVREIVDWMLTRGVKMIIMACNTSSALALDIVRDEYDVPILGLILPGAMAAVKRGKRIGVIATPATAASNAYGLAIQEIDPNTKVWQVGCPEFVTLIEQNRLNSPYTKEVAYSYLQPLIAQNIDTLIYGCTHYRHLEKIFQSILPPAVQIVDPAEYIVMAANKELELMGLKNNLTPAPTQYYVTGSSRQFALLSEQLLGYLPEVTRVKIDEQPIAIDES